MKYILQQHFKSTRFVIIVLVLMLSFISAIIKTIFKAFPFEVLIGVLNGAAIISYVTKTLEPGASERRNKDL